MRKRVAFLLLAGAWHLVLSRHVFETFPGFGMAWGSADGPFNEHLVHDFGGANLALGLAGLAIALRPRVAVVRGFALAVLVAQVAHVAYHAARLAQLPTATDRVVQALSLGLLVGLATLLALVAGGIGEPSSATAIGKRDGAGGRVDRNEAAPTRALARRAGVR